MVTPNFLIIGDVKAGTSSLYHYLRQHPQVYMPYLKELRYFACDPDNPYHLRSSAYPIKTFSEYLSRFEACKDAIAIGEASPSYLRSPIAAQRIKIALPDVRLIACLRNPADRLYSEYLMDYRDGRTAKSFEEELFDREASWVKARFYWFDLKKYFDLFPRNKIKIFLFDELKADTELVTRELFKFLEIDGSFVPDFTAQNEGGMPRNRLTYSIFSKGKKMISRFCTPPVALKRISKKISRGLLQKSKIDPHIRKKILEICEDDIKRTQELIGRDLSGWLR